MTRRVEISAALLLLAVLAARIRLLPLPLERDEGEFAYIGSLLRHGVPPFEGAYTLKLPGTALCYALANGLCGDGAVGVHLGLLMANAAACALLWALGRRLFNPAAGAAAAALYALLSLSQGVFGASAHATQFAVAWALGACLLLTRPGAWRVAAAGACFGLAALAKQPAAALALAAWPLMRLRRETVGRQAALFVGGLLAPFLSLGLWVWRAGTWQRAWDWTVVLARDYAGRQGLAAGLKALGEHLPASAAPQAPLWILGAAGLLALAWRRPPGARFTVLLFLSGFAACSAGLYYRAHYFVLVLPGLALAGARALTQLPVAAAWKPWACAGLLGLLGAVGLAREADVLYQLPPERVIRKLLAENPFPEAPEVARYLAAHTRPDERIAVLGSEPEILYLAQRRSATGFIYMYEAVGPGPHAAALQEQLIAELEAARPAYLVMVALQVSWLPYPGAPTRLLDWAQAWRERDYERVGLVDIDEQQSRFYWDEASQGRRPARNFYLTVWRRKP